MLEVLVAVTMESAVVWVEMLCRFDRVKCCEETYFS
jgi:hypothetical protein